MPTNSGKNLHQPKMIIDDEQRVSGTGNNLASSRGDTYWYIDYMDIKPNTQYTFSIKPDTEYKDGVYYHVLDKDYEFVLGSDRSPISVGNGHTITTPPSSKYIRYSFLYGLEYSIQFEEGSTATEYEPPAPAPEDMTFDLRNKKLYVGNQGVDQAYLGSNLIYSSPVWPYKTLRISMDGGVTWADFGRPTDLQNYQFAFRGITHLEIPDSVTYIGGLAFMNNEIESLRIPESVKLIGFSAFEENNLTYVEFPETLESIEDNAFSSNPLLTQVRISSQTSYVGSGSSATFDSHTNITTY